MKSDLRSLPKLRDSISYVYIEHAVIEQEDSSIIFLQEHNKIPVPVSSVTCLLIGPGVNITHAAVKVICDNGCMVIWCGENASRFYASGMGETRSSANILEQAKHCMDKELHIQVVRRMYELRFPRLPLKDLSIQQIRGMEGIRVKAIYKTVAQKYGVRWNFRNYNKSDWDSNDPINKALSIANFTLYSLCHAAIISLGYSPALGFIHSGKMMSFVYDIADLYKAETSIPAAFEAVKKAGEDLSRDVRLLCRKYFTIARILKRIPKDIEFLFSITTDAENEGAEPIEEIWEASGNIRGGINYAESDLKDDSNSIG